MAGFLRADLRTQTVALPDGEEAIVRELTAAQALKVRLLAGRGDIEDAFFLIAACGIDGLTEEDLPAIRERGDLNSLTIAVNAINALSGMGDTAVEDAAKN